MLNTHHMCGGSTSMVGKWSIKRFNRNEKFVDINLLTNALGHNLE